jgi:hypothetical protein
MSELVETRQSMRTVSTTCANQHHDQQGQEGRPDQPGPARPMTVMIEAEPWSKYAAIQSPEFEGISHPGDASTSHAS